MSTTTKDTEMPHRPKTTTCAIANTCYFTIYSLHNEPELIVTMENYNHVDLYQSLFTTASTKALRLTKICGANTTLLYM